jgi:hypothetical protein
MALSKNKKLLGKKTGEMRTCCNSELKHVLARGLDQ